MNFGLLHMPHPEQALSESYRVLRPNGRLAFTVWAKPGESPGASIINGAIEAHADLSIPLPQGPPYYLYSDKDQCRTALESVGFSGESMTFDTLEVRWLVSEPGFPFEAELHAGVRTAALLANQPQERLAAIRSAVEDGVKRYATSGGYALPMAAYIIGISKA